MSTSCKPLYIPRFGSQSSQTDTKLKPKLIKTIKKVTCESSMFTVLDSISPEVTPCYSRKVKTSCLLRFYCSVKANKKTFNSSDNLMLPDGVKSQQIKDLSKDPVQIGPSSDDFQFPSGDVQAKDEKSRIKQDVLRAVKRMMEENRVIRERLLALSQMSKSS